MQFSFRKHTLALSLVGSLALAACGDGDVTGVEDDHGEAAQVQLVMNGSAIATFTFATNISCWSFCCRRYCERCFTCRVGN